MRSTASLALIVVVLAGCRGGRGSAGSARAPADGDVAGAADASVVLDTAAGAVEVASIAAVDAAQDVGADAGQDAGPDAHEPALAELATLCGAVPVTFDDWERCWHRRWCQWSVGCPQNHFADVQDCVDNSDWTGEVTKARRQRRRAVEQGRATIDVAAFARCLVATSPALCDTAYVDPSCARRYVGTVPAGGDCYADVECASARGACVRDCVGACCKGTCRAAFKVGEACDTYTSCEPGLQCNRGRCVAGDVGGPCTDVGDCDPGAWCDLKEGICKPSLAPHAVCTSVLQCGGETVCAGIGGPGGIIGSPEGRCLPVTKEGDPCVESCLGNLACLPSGPADRLCQYRPRLGQPCDLHSCRGAGVFCTNGVCAKLEDEGKPCTRFCQFGAFCTSELGDPNPTCVRPRADGMACTEPWQCASFLCSGKPAQPGQCLPWLDRCP